MSAGDDRYLVARVHEALLADDRLHDQALEVEVVGAATIAVRGEVATPQRRAIVLEIVGRLAPDVRIVADIRVSSIVTHPESEAL